MKQPKTRQKNHPIDSATVELWRDRLDQLRGKLSENDQAEWAWLWRARLAVLEYLIHRYDAEWDSDQGDTDPTSLSSKPSRGTYASARLEHVAPYDHKPADGTAYIGNDKCETIHSRLASLRSANVKRHADSEKAAEVMREQIRVWRARLTPCPTLVEPDDEDHLRLAEALQALDELEYKKMRQYIAFDLGLIELVDEPLDDETIRLILSEHKIEPDEPD